MLEVGNSADLEARLRTLMVGTESRRLVLVVGSGLSNGTIPSVSEMIELFRDELDEGGSRRLTEILRDADDVTLGYQNAASLVKHRAGERAVANAIRRAVLSAIPRLTDAERRQLATSPEQCIALLKQDGWEVPRGYQNLARIYSALPSEQRGPVITTNFDPLLTLALRQAGISAEAIPVPLDAPPSGEQLAASISIPVLHMHGYWTSDNTLHGISQLTRPRPALEGTLREAMRDSVVLVIGYGGWKDAFMASLDGRIKEASILGAEVLWAVFDSHLPAGSALATLTGVPGFSFYLGVDGHRLSIDSAEVQAPAPFGFARVARAHPYSATQAQTFVEGMQPTWGDAREWPALTNAVDLFELVRRAVEEPGASRLIVASGPIGEGKSLALRQAAVQIESVSDGVTVLWKEAGGPRLTESWFDGLSREYPNVVMFIDEADLVIDDLRAAQHVWAANPGLVIVMAMHDRIWNFHRPRFASLAAEEVLFSGLVPEDADAIAAAWKKWAIDVAPSTHGETTAERLIKSASLGRVGSTLFGAVLDVRFGEGLRDRVRDLVAKLERVAVADDGSLNLGQIFLGICLLQDMVKSDRDWGASRSLVASMANLPGVLSDGRILGELGREAAISFAGQRVLARHPVIAHHAVADAAASGRLVDVARLVGRAGGRMRAIGGIEPAEYRNAYLLGRTVRDPAVAEAAANGALEGAPRLLEARVTRMAVLRRIDCDRSLRYASEVALHLDEFDDRRSGVRAFFNEFSVAARQAAGPARAAGLAALALADDVGFALDDERAQYGLGSLYNATLDLRRQQSRLVRNSPEASYVLAGALKNGPTIIGRHFDRRNSELGAVTMKPQEAIRVIERECSEFVDRAKSDLRLPGLPARLLLRDLEMLVSGREA